MTTSTTTMNSSGNIDAVRKELRETYTFWHPSILLPKEPSSEPIIETEVESLVNLKPTQPFATEERKCHTPSVFVNYDVATGKFEKVVGYKFDFAEIASNNRIEADVLECIPKTFEDVVNFLLEAVCVDFPLGPQGFLEVLGNLLPYKNKVELGRTKETYIDGVYVRITKGCFSVRKGNQYGRAFAMWDELPKWCIDPLDEYDPEPMTIDEFVKVWLLLYSDMYKEGLSMASLNSTASVGSNYLLNTKARQMFGHWKDIPDYVLPWAHQAYKGAIFESSNNVYGNHDYLDLISNHPYEASLLLPCYPPYMKWQKVNEVDKEALRQTLKEDAYYAFLKCLIIPTEMYRWAPSSLRYLSPYGFHLGGFFGPQIATITLPEYRSLTYNELARVEVLGGCFGIPEGEPLFRFAGPMHKLFGLRDHPNLGRLAKSASQTVVGKMGSTFLDDEEVIKGDKLVLQDVTKTSPIFNLVYCAHVNGAQRAKVKMLALLTDADYIRADGIGAKVGTKIPDKFNHNRMGGLKRKVSGKTANPDDMLWEGPEGVALLSLLSSMRPGQSKFAFQRRTVTTFKGELLRSRGELTAGVVKNLYDKRELGTHKRFLKVKNTKANFDYGGIESTPVKGREGLEFIRRRKSGYDYC